jgi:hypothetical protein
MPHSPYRRVVYPPIDDLDEYRHILRQSRSQFEEGEKDMDAQESLLETGDNLLEHCDFLDEKLDIKGRIHFLCYDFDCQGGFEYPLTS